MRLAGILTVRPAVGLPVGVVVKAGSMAPVATVGQPASPGPRVGSGQIAGMDDGGKGSAVAVGVGGSREGRRVGSDGTKEGNRP